MCLSFGCRQINPQESYQRGYNTKVSLLKCLYGAEDILLYVSLINVSNK